jgi:hypothetical protein
VEYWIKKLVKPTRDDEALRLRADALRDELDQMVVEDSEEAMKKFVPKNR